MTALTFFHAIVAAGALTMGHIYAIEANRTARTAFFVLAWTLNAMAVIELVAAIAALEGRP